MEEKAKAPPPLKVESIMTGEVQSVTPEMTVREAIMLLTNHKISGAPVVDTFNKVLSVVTEGDLLKLAATSGLDKTIQHCISKLTKPEKLMTLSKSSTFSEAYMMFLTNPVHRIIILDGNGKLQGLVSRSNILRVLCSPNQDEGKQESEPKLEVVKT